MNPDWDGWISASDPADVGLSLRKLWRLPAPRWARSLPPAALDQRLRHGDCRAAVVVSSDPLLIAAYTDELDCAVLLRFPVELAAAYGLEVGSRLLAVTTYARQGERAEDLKPGPRASGEVRNVLPLIAEFLVDDLEAVEARKAQISEDEWRRAGRRARTALRRQPKPIRHGHPYVSQLSPRRFRRMAEHVANLPQPEASSGAVEAPERPPSVALNVVTVLLLVVALVAALAA
ncbi:MAG: hypothetical protein R3F62_31640 [Planctomycetota bacterium]